MAPSALAGTRDVPTVPVFKTGLVRVLLVNVSVVVLPTKVSVVGGKVRVTLPLYAL